MTKRDIFAELMDGFGALKEAREGKRTLRTTVVESKAAPKVTRVNVKVLRERFNMSQPVFARKLRTKPQTIKNWEQGISTPNDQAAILLALIERNPKLLEEIAAL